MSAELETLIRNAQTDRSAVPELCRLLQEGSVVLIGSWVDPEATRLLIQDFILSGQRFIPLFSDEMHFWNQMNGTPYLNRGLAIDCKSLLRLLRGNELLILNPGTAAPVQLCKADFESSEKLLVASQAPICGREPFQESSTLKSHISDLQSEISKSELAPQDAPLPSGIASRGLRA